MKILSLCCFFLLFGFSNGYCKDIVSFQEKGSDLKSVLLSIPDIQQGITEGYSHLDNIMVSRIDLNDDGNKELLVYDTTHTACGSHGCSFKIYEKKKGGYHSILSVITYDVIKVGDISSNKTGYKDVYLSLSSSGFIRWSYNGTEYDWHNK